MGSLQEWLPAEDYISGLNQFDALLDFANSQRTAPKTTAHSVGTRQSRAVGTRQSREQGVYQLYQSSVLEVDRG